MVRLCVWGPVMMVCCMLAFACGQRSAAAQADAADKAEVNSVTEPATTTSQGSPTSSKPQAVKLPEVVVKDAHETDLPDQEAVKEIPGGSECGHTEGDPTCPPQECETSW